MRTRTPAAMLVAFCAVVCAATPVLAQTPASTTDMGASRFELAVGLTWGGSVSLGDRAATLTPNLNGAPFVLFDASAKFHSPLGGEARLGYRVVPWMVASLSGGSRWRRAGLAGP